MVTGRLDVNLGRIQSQIAFHSCRPMARLNKGDRIELGRLSRSSNVPDGARGCRLPPRESQVAFLALVEKSACLLLRRDRLHQSADR